MKKMKNLLGSEDDEWIIYSWNETLFHNHFRDVRYPVYKKGCVGCGGFPPANISFLIKLMSKY